MQPAITHHRRTEHRQRCCLSRSIVATTGVALVTELHAAGEALNTRQGDDMTAPLIIALLISLAIGISIIVGLVLWGRKQEHIGEMMLFCMKFLLRSSDDVSERCASARALGEARDIGALLVLVDIISDEEEAEAVHGAAREALHAMSLHSRKRRDVIADLELNIERQDSLGIINTLIDKFEQGKKRYAQSAFIIGRHYMRLSHYVEAREWLTRAEFRNRKFNLYGERIDYWINTCNKRLLIEADASFEAADYYQAKEHYAVLDHGLSEAEKRHCAIYLRITCVYCKLRDYANADQALLQALEHNHQTDYALELVPLLRPLLEPAAGKGVSKEKLKSIEARLDARTTEIMRDLTGQECTA
jgi:tetratricopeptide (TPR) repeat protein